MRRRVFTGPASGGHIGCVAAAPLAPPFVEVIMYVIFGILAVGFVVAGFVGLVGGVVAIVFWALAAICLGIAVKTYPRGRKGPRSGAQ